MSLNNHPPIYALVFIGIALLLVSCDNQITQPEPDTKLLPIPDHGATPLPNMTEGDSTLLVRSGQAESQELPPAYKMLNEYAKAHPENPYVAVVGIWDKDQEQYTYKSIPLYFPEDMLEKAAGERAYYWYRQETGDSHIMRNLATLVPAASNIKNIMNRWLRLQKLASATQINTPQTVSTDSVITNLKISMGGYRWVC